MYHIKKEFNKEIKSKEDNKKSEVSKKKSKSSSGIKTKKGNNKAYKLEILKQIYAPIKINLKEDFKVKKD